MTEKELPEEDLLDIIEDDEWDEDDYWDSDIWDDDDLEIEAE